MENKTQIVSAGEARAIALTAQNNAIDMAMTIINNAAKQGFEETVLFNMWLSLEGMKELMDLGYSVTTIHHPFEQRKVIKVSW